MRVVAGHGADCDVRSLRQILLGAGLTCEASDCVPWPRLSERLAQVDADVVLLHAPSDPQGALAALSEIRSLTRGRLFFAGSRDDAERARSAGASAFLDAAALREQLDDAVGQLRASAGGRGQVLAVFAPLAGSGAATIGANLAETLSRGGTQKAAVIEATRGMGRLALMLQLEGGRPLSQVCGRWASLDGASLSASLANHSSGIRALAPAAEEERNEHFHCDAVRRMAVLSRTTFAHTVFVLDPVLGDEEAVVMRLADKTLLVVRPDIPSVRRARLALQRAEERGVPRERLLLVINRWGQKGQLPRKEIEAALHMKTAALIPDDPGKVNRAANEGRLLRQQSGLSRICRRFNRLAIVAGSAAKAAAR